MIKSQFIASCAGLVNQPTGTRGAEGTAGYGAVRRDGIRRHPFLNGETGWIERRIGGEQNVLAAAIEMHSGVAIGERTGKPTEKALGTLVDPISSQRANIGSIGDQRL